MGLIYLINEVPTSSKNDKQLNNVIIIVFIPYKNTLPSL